MLERLTVFGSWRSSMTLLSIVLPVFNEEDTLPILRVRLGGIVERLRQERGLEVEAVLVDDGSKDLTPALLAAWARQEPWVRVLELSRNFGHQAALTAGLDAARGDLVVMMDSDLQDPPDLIFAMLDRQAAGCDVVYARRREREGETAFKRASAWLFYRVMRRLVHRDLPPDTGDFRLMTRAALAALLGMRERHRFLRGMSVWIGFRQGEVLYDRAARAAGTTKYPLRKMLRFAWNAAVSFSTLPLTLVALWGTLVSLFGLGYLVYTVYRFFVFKDTVPGWATLIVLLCLIGGSILVSLGIIGSYLGKVFEELKGRPLYIVREAINLPLSEAAPHDARHRGEREPLPRHLGV